MMTICNTLHVDSTVHKSQFITIKYREHVVAFKTVIDYTVNINN